MRNAEDVTFGTGGLDRAAELRANRPMLEAMQRGHDASILPVWHGKPLIIGPERDRLGGMLGDHPLAADAEEPPVFLGRADGRAWFALDVSHWVPEGQDTEGLGLFLDPSEQHPPGLPEDHRFSELRAVMSRLTRIDAEIAATARAVLGWHRTHRFCSRCGVRSQAAMAGWERVCPDCGGKHFPRTDPVVIMLITRGNSVLVGRSPGWPEGMYSLLAGFAEPGETMEAAVRREVFEEAGIRVGAVEYLSSQPWPFPASLMLGCHGHALDADITLDPAELEAARWVTREEMLTVFAGQHPEIKPARKGAIAHFLLWNWLADTMV